MAPSPPTVAKAAEAVSRVFRKWDSDRSGKISHQSLCRVLADLGLGKEVAEVFITEVRCIDYQTFVDWAFGLRAVSDTGSSKAGLSDTKQVKLASVLGAEEPRRPSRGADEHTRDHKNRSRFQAPIIHESELEIPVQDGPSIFDETFTPERHEVTMHPTETHGQSCAAKELFSTTRGPGGVRSLQFSSSALEFTMRLQGSRREHEGTLSAVDAVRGSSITWTRGDHIGSGSMGKVFKALNQKSGEIIAVKEVRIDEGQTDDRKFRKELENEISIIKDLRHERIVSYLGCDYIDSNLYVYLEYMPGGSLAQVLTEFGALDASLCAAYTRDAVEGLAYLHTQEPPVLHRDIKGANMLLSMECRVKLTDFGCSKRLEDSKSATMRGSIPWMAPEVINGSGGGRPADIWSLGCVVIELATAKLPWGGFDNHMAAMYKIGMSKKEIPIPEDLIEDGRSFIRRCTQRDHDKRPTAQDLLNHEFVGALLVTSLSGTM